MTSFLYRIAASRALEPRAAIHPLVRPHVRVARGAEPPEGRSSGRRRRGRRPGPAPAEAPITAPLPAALFRPDPPARTPGPSAARPAALHPSAPRRRAVARRRRLSSPPPAPAAVLFCVTARPAQPPRLGPVGGSASTPPVTAAVGPTPRSSGRRHLPAPMSPPRRPHGPTATAARSPRRPASRSRQARRGGDRRARRQSERCRSISAGLK